jgi:hypothetical protein
MPCILVTDTELSKGQQSRLFSFFERLGVENKPSKGSTFWIELQISRTCLKELVLKIKQAVSM